LLMHFPRRLTTALAYLLGARSSVIRRRASQSLRMWSNASETFSGGQNHCGCWKWRRKRKKRSSLSLSMTSCDCCFFRYSFILVGFGKMVRGGGTGGAFRHFQRSSIGSETNSLMSPCDRVCTVHSSVASVAEISLVCCTIPLRSLNTATITSPRRFPRDRNICSNSCLDTVALLGRRSNNSVLHHPHHHLRLVST
jgi:hypothetical protein